MLPLRLFAITSFVYCLYTATSDFVYLDFSDTTGLAFVGTAATTSCDNGTLYSWYQPRHGTEDGIDNGTIPELLTVSTAHMESQGQQTDNATTSGSIASKTSVIGHRDAFVASPDLNGTTCSLRLRLTASQPNKHGAFWRLVKVPILSGFDTVFRFQVTDHSRSCTQVKDRHFRTFHHESCMVHGGDGFAFVIQLDPNGTTTIGSRGEGLGYAGIRNTLVVEFDTWYNPEQGDLFTDHVSVQLSGPKGSVTVGESSRLATVQPHDIADGAVHTVRVTYFKFINYDLLPRFTGSSALLPYLIDNGEGKRIGTLAVYIDDMSTPIIVFPINLSVALDVPEGEVYAGFTASTGRSWEKHDVLSWIWCDLPGCPLTSLNASLYPDPSFVPNLDYHQDNRLYYRRLLHQMKEGSPYEIL